MGESKMGRCEGRGASGRNKYIFIACLSLPTFVSPYQEPVFLWYGVIYTNFLFTPNGVTPIQLEVRLNSTLTLGTEYVSSKKKKKSVLVNQA